MAMQRKSLTSFPLAISLMMLAVCGVLAPSAFALGPGGFKSLQAVQLPCERFVIGVCHQDDDLLFINPEIRHQIDVRCPVTTIYLTAGDNGVGMSGHWVESREEGLRAAYAEMARLPDRWSEQPVTVAGRTIRSSVLNGGADVRLIFLRLPDSSLPTLFTRGVDYLVPVDGSAAAYSENDLVSTITQLSTTAMASRILTLDYDNTQCGWGELQHADNCDHTIAAKYFRKAGFLRQIPVVPHLGYNMSSFAPNLSITDTAQKTATFRTYLEHQGCPQDCGTASVTAKFIPEYQNWVRKTYVRFHRSPDAGELMSAIGSEDPATGLVEQCLGVAGENQVSVRNCGPNHLRLWTFTGDQVKIGNQCLTAPLGSSGIGLSQCDNSTRQAWQRQENGQIRSVSQGLCLRQDDLFRPNPALRLADCTVLEPESTWLWAP
ncbi:ricin-type beta-trefoil lectin domain protein [Streptomyces lavendulae]|uniref:ricin-type beta-trefoil lectin domain protein n=1 Tax=Streptomyces lavendulae TaxID=1914 RepID=UPI00371F9B93